MAPDRMSISIAEAAEQLGLSVWTIRKLIRDEGLPSIQLAGKHGRVIIPVEALKSWLDERTTAA